MRVFSLFFKILRSKLGQSLLYVGIFCGIMILFMNVGDKENADTYEEKQSKYALVDEDGSDVSRAFAKYLEDTQEKVKLSAVTGRAVQDALYNRDVDCVITIPAGFGAALTSGEADGLLDIVTIPGSQDSMLLESRVNSYLGMMSLYIGSGEKVDTADERTREALSVRADVSIADGTAGHSAMYAGSSYTYFNYLGWALVAAMIVGLTPVLLTCNRKLVRDRIACSSYRTVRVNLELVLASFVASLVLCAAFLILITAMSVGENTIVSELMSEKGLLYVVNMLVYAVVALAITFFISRFAANEEMINMCANIVSLGMAFLCGIFVPMEYMGEGVETIAHFLPAYWYSEACGRIDSCDGGSISSIASCMGVELLFAAALIVLAMALAGSFAKSGSVRNAEVE